MFVYVFTERDIEKILSDLSDLKATFEAFGEFEVFAKSHDESVRVGRYRRTTIVVSEKRLKFSVEPLDVYEITLEEFEENVLLENIPPLLSDLTVAKVLAKDARLRAEYLTKEETEIIKEISKILEGAKTLSVSKLEELAYSASSLKGEFFSAYMQFKDELEEMSSALIRAREFSLNLNKLFFDEIEWLERNLDSLRQYESSFESTLNGVRDALDTVHLKLESLHRKENLELQRKTSSLQAAAAVIEFIAVFYYSMGIWSKFVDLSLLPKWLTFSLLAALSTLVVLCTEAVGEVLTSKKFSKKFYLVTSMLALVILTMFLISLRR